MANGFDVLQVDDYAFEPTALFTFKSLSTSSIKKYSKSKFKFQKAYLKTAHFISAS